MKIYISGKISNLPRDIYYANFEQGEIEAVRFFRKYCSFDTTIETVNPVKKVSESDGLTYDEFMREDIKLICECAGMYMLNNWKDSKGATLEHEIAERLHLAIAYQNDPE